MLDGAGEIDPDVLDAEWHRCRREARTLLVLELVQLELAMGILVVVAVCGIVAMTHSAVASGEVALPLGLALAVTLALVFHGLAWRARMGREVSRGELFTLQCARARLAAERARYDRGGHPYRSSLLLAREAKSPECVYCLLGRE